MRYLRSHVVLLQEASPRSGSRDCPVDGSEWGDDRLDPFALVWDRYAHMGNDKDMPELPTFRLFSRRVRLHAQARSGCQS